ncbi:hypothetical protein DN549_33580, partial [Burkholderia multivorans]
MATSSDRGRPRLRGLRRGRTRVRLRHRRLGGRWRSARGQPRRGGVHRRRPRGRREPRVRVLR